MSYDQDEIEALWNARDVAAYLKVSRSWVYQKADEGRLPYRRIGNLIRFEPATIRAWVTGSDQAASSEHAKGGR